MAAISTVTAAADPPAASTAALAIAGTTAARQGEARSLFGEILDWMFAPLLLLWPMSVTLTYLVAQSIASTPYDHALIERGEALAAHVRFTDGRAGFDLDPGLQEIYGDGRGEAGTYVIVDSDGSVLAGDPDLPHPRNDAPGTGNVLNGAFQLRDDTLRGEPVRVASAHVAAPSQAPATAPLSPAAAGHPASAAASGEGASRAVLVAVAEPPTERTQLANEIVKGVILPQFIVLPLALLLVWFGLTRGLAPLSRLQKTIRNRPPDDLSPIGADAAPEEIAPLLAAFNDLLARMTRNVAVQRRFIADAAHQMKTPLAGLRTQAELAQRGGDPEDLQRSLRQIAAATDRATRLINQMLALARAEHDGGAALALVTVDLDRLARSVVQDWVATALAQNIDLGYEGPHEQAVPAAGGAGDFCIRGAPVPLSELLNNLIDNALRYTAPPRRDGAATGDPASPGSHPCGTVTVRVRRNPQGIVLEVEDSGPGIAPEERAQIFERFYRILGSGQDGSGLGLAIVREIALHHGATVSVESASKAPPGGPGARFRVLFPASEPAQEGAARSV